MIRKYDASSEIYDRRYVEIQTQKYQNIFFPEKFENFRLLDAGCGTGLFLEYLCEKKINKKDFTGFYIGNDISRGMISQFKSKIWSFPPNFRSKITLLVSDIDFLPFRDSIFDMIGSFTSLQNLPQIETGFKELIRVSAKKGLLFISILNKQLDMGSIEALMENKLNNIQIIHDPKLEDIIIQAEKKD